MKPHRLAKYFPLLEGEEFDLLVEDIKKNGQLEPIVTYQGEILDGVNRWEACERLGIEPITEEYEGNDPESYVVSLNIKRRHLNKGQIALLLDKIYPVEKTDGEKTAPSRRIKTNKELAKEHHVGVRTLSRARRINKEMPGRIPEVMSGKITIDSIDTELRKKKAAERAAELKEKQDDKTVKERPRIVAEYIESTKSFKEALQLAVAGAKRDRFAPEAMQFIEHRHGEIRELMNELEELNER